MSDFHQSRIDNINEIAEEVERKVGETRLVRRAKMNLAMAQSMHDRGIVFGGEGATKDHRFGWGAHLEAAQYALQMASAEPILKKGIDYIAAQSERGKAGAAKRWGADEARDEINAIIIKLANRRDWLGDHWSADDLWPEFQGDLDVARLESDMNFKTFQNRLSEARKQSR